MTHELTARERKRGSRQAAVSVRRTRRWYREQLISIVDGKVKCTATQLSALKTFADLMGWKGPRLKRNVVDPKKLNRPAVTDDLAARLSALVPKAVVQPTGLVPIPVEIIAAKEKEAVQVVEPPKLNVGQA